MVGNRQKPHETAGMGQGEMRDKSAGLDPFILLSQRTRGNRMVGNRQKPRETAGMEQGEMRDKSAGLRRWLRLASRVARFPRR